MKTSIFFFATLAACSLCLTSCGNDSLTDRIMLDESNQIIQNEITTRSSGEPFLFEEVVQLEADEAFGDVDKFGARGPDTEDKGAMDRFQKAPSVAITGFGDSHILNWGSWYVEVDLMYDPTNNSVAGTLLFTYPDYGDEVEFVVSGQPALVTDPDDNSQQLVLRLTINEGTGRFEGKTFEGSAVLTDVGSLIDSAGDLRTYLMVDGTIVDRI